MGSERKCVLATASAFCGVPCPGADSIVHEKFSVLVLLSVLGILAAIRRRQKSKEMPSGARASLANRRRKAWRSFVVYAIPAEIRGVPLAEGTANAKSGRAR
jgi:hypothetical protein